jgi:hypothetical protein
MVHGVIPAAIPGNFTIASIALKDATGVIAVADGSGDTMHGSESPIPQAYSVTFLLPLSSTDNFSIIMGAGGNYLPLAGGTMEMEAVIDFPRRPSTGPSSGGEKTKIGNGVILLDSDPSGGGGYTQKTEIVPSKIETRTALGSSGTRSIAIETRVYDGPYIVFGHGGHEMRLRMEPTVGTPGGRYFGLVAEAKDNSGTWHEIGKFSGNITM